MAHDRKFRFGVAAYDTASMEDWRELARRAEGLGYSSLLIGDHFVEHIPVAGASPLLALAAAAAVTDTLIVGTHVLGNDFRHPAMLAKDAATLDQLSSGRMELGIGAGWLEADYDVLGLPYEPPRVRIDRLTESLEIIKSAWSGEPFDFAGEHYTICNYTGIPRPVQQPRPPIMVGGGSRRMLRLAARHADIVGVHVRVGEGSLDVGSDTHEEQTRRKLVWVREGAGGRFDELEIQMATAVTVTERSRAGDPPSSVMEVAGTLDEVCEELERRRREWGVSYIVVPAAECETVAPVVARLAGT